MKRISWIGLVALSVFVLGSALSGTAATAADNVLKIAMISPVSGNYGDHGALERAGMEMALKDLGGKIGGRPVEFVVADTETNPDTAARRTRSLIEKDGIKIFMGGVSSSECAAVGTVAKERNVLYIATNGNSDELTSTKAVRNMFRIAPSMAVLGRVNANYAFDNLGKKWFFLTHDYGWGHSGTRWARDVLKKRGATDMGEVKVPMGTRDFSAQLLQIRNSGADVLITTCGGFDRVALMKQMAEYRIHDKIKHADNLMDYVDAWALKPEERQGFWATEMSWDETEKMKEASKRFAAMFPKAPVQVMECINYNGYMAIMAIAEAVEKAGTADDVDKMIKALEGLEVKQNLRDKPTYIDPRTHQFLGTVVMVEANPKSTGVDIWKVLKTYNAADYEMTPEENPIDLRK